MTLARLSLLTVALLAGCPASGGTGNDGDECEDSDQDHISDLDEGTADLDDDGSGNPFDSDSDGDGLFDADEAGDDDPCTLPRDSDGDGQYDFQDTDSDNDGLSDRDEHERTRTDPTDADSDDDDYDDGVEVLAGTDPNDATSVIPPEDFYVILPFEGGSVLKDLSFGARLERADVFFLVDTTASMGTAITNVQEAFTDVLVPGLRAAVPDVELGVGAFQDFALDPYGWGPENPLELPCDDRPFVLHQSVTDDFDDVRAGLDLLDNPLGCGNDPSEAAIEGLFQVVTGDGAGSWVAPAPACPEDPEGEARGAACFRAGAQPIVVLVSDAPFHNGPDGYDPYAGLPEAATYDEATAALGTVGARVIGLAVDGDSLVRSQMEEIALDTGTVDADGLPLVYDAPAGEAGEWVVDAVTQLAGGTPQDISLEVEDHPDDAFDATRFLTSIRAVRAEPQRTIEAGKFLSVPPGGTVFFELVFENDIVEGSDRTVIFRATIHVVGNGVARLEKRNVYVVVPTEDGIFLI